MIYLFRKRNGLIIATSKESAHRQMVTPNNFITHQPEYMGAVTPQALADLKDRLEEEMPIQVEKLVKKDGEDTLITLTEGQIMDAIDNGDKRLEKQYEALMKKKAKRHHELMAELAETADKTQTPANYDKQIAAVEDVRGDVSGVLAGYKNPV